MKSKAPLALMEQIIMVMVFALAATLCMQLFVFSHRVSSRNEAVDRAAMHVQTIAEEIKDSNGDLDSVMNAHGASYDGTEWMITVADTDNTLLDKSFDIYVSCIDSGLSNMGLAKISAIAGGKDTLISIECGWQEVSGNE